MSHGGCGNYLGASDLLTVESRGPSRVYQEVVLNEEDGMKSSCAVNLHNAPALSHNACGRISLLLLMRRTSV